MSSEEDVMNETCAPGGEQWIHSVQVLPAKTGDKGRLFRFPKVKVVKMYQQPLQILHLLSQGLLITYILHCCKNVIK
jgi:hypothetical protein